MENRAHAIAAGLFVIVFGLALVLVAFWFSGDTEREDTYVLVSEASVTGLNPQAAVRYRGIQVGRVESIQLDRSPERKILIRILVNQETPITQGTFAELAYQGLTGLSYIQLDDDGSDSRTLATRPGKPARIEMKPSVLQEVGSSAPLLLARVSFLIERMTELFDKQNIQYVRNTLTNVEAVSARFLALQTKLEPTLDALPAVATDAQGVLKSANALFADLSRVTKQFEETMKQVGQIAKSAGKVASSAEKIGKTGEDASAELRTSTLPKFGELLDELSRTSRNLDKLLTNIEKSPQSLLFGKPEIKPGPGEAGFTPAP